MRKPGNFVIRVYGLIINEKNEVLITDEFQLGMKMTKFPGGGLQFGEGTVDCLKREMREECNDQEIKKLQHFYTTDFYQKALFYENHQLISIYYRAELIKPLKFKISTKPFDFEKMEDGKQSFRWVKINQLSENNLTFPIDKIVAEKLILAFAI
ncbi:NUDIX domain-containing protein [Maribellus comscasis]|uniref:NUDIX domain-containing protein n=1 Tax=Maribellus comscasis TaxID=2681766 RepID=A0A6I6JJS4_9BACT|nr:NUDIX domain-containing protein [Maribellus comscasis]QGY43115.1 NUDIX domain-containing protein [Maribellus comscasis]